VAVKKNTDSQETRGVKTIQRVLDILEVLEEYPDGLSLVEITEKIHLPKSTVHRFLSILLDRQYVRESFSNGKYLLGYQILSLSKACIKGIDLIREARPFLEQINSEFNETVILGGLDQAKFSVVYLDKIDTSHTLRLVSHVGERAPIHCTALGKAILSGFNDEELLDRLSKYELRRFTENSIVDMEDLIQIAHEINQKGYAIDNQEYKSHISCIAAPVFGTDGKPIGAVGISMPTSRFSESKQESIIHAVLEATREISKILSFTKTQDVW